VIPSGGSRDKQFENVMRSVEFAISRNAVLPSFTNEFVTVTDDEFVETEVVCAPERYLRVVPGAMN
jgi:hypothetical protein